MVRRLAPIKYCHSRLDWTCKLNCTAANLNRTEVNHSCRLPRGVCSVLSSGFGICASLGEVLSSCGYHCYYHYYLFYRAKWKQIENPIKSLHTDIVSPYFHFFAVTKWNLLCTMLTPLLCEYCHECVLFSSVLVLKNRSECFDCGLKENGVKCTFTQLCHN